MSLSPTDTRTALDLLVEIRRTQGRTLERFENDWRHAMHFRTEVRKLDLKVDNLKAAIPADPTSPQIVRLSRDLTEFKDEVVALRRGIGELTIRTGNVKTDIDDIKTTLDILQTRLEESDS